MVSDNLPPKLRNFDSNYRQKEEITSHTSSECNYIGPSMSIACIEWKTKDFESRKELKI